METAVLRAGRPTGRRLARPTDRPRTGLTRRGMKVQQDHRPDEAQGDARQPLSPSARTMTLNRRRSMWLTTASPVNRRARSRWRPEMTDRQPGPQMKAAKTARTRVVRIIRTLPVARVDKATVRLTRETRAAARTTRAGRAIARATRATVRLTRATVRLTRTTAKAGATTTPAIGVTIAAVVAATVQVRAASARLNSREANIRDPACCDE